MDPTTIVTTIATIITQAVTLGPTIIKAVEDAQPFAQLIYNMLSGGTITQQQVDDTLAQLDALTAQLQAPLPPDDGTTTT